MLLSGEYTTGLDMNRIEEYIENQYHPKLANDKQSWKIGTEYWPNNIECKNSTTDKAKLFLLCTSYYDLSTKDSVIESTDNTKIILFYTDLHTQLRMCYNKKANFFNNLIYNNPTRPCYGKSDSKYLRCLFDRGAIWNNQLCNGDLPKIQQIFPNLEAVSLRDLLQNYPRNTKQQWLIDRWLSLHNKKELRHLL